MNSLLSNYLKGNIKKTIPIGACNGVRDVYLDDSDSSSDEELQAGVGYVESYVEEEMKKYAEAAKNDYCAGDSALTRVDYLDPELDVDEDKYKAERFSDIYNKFKFDASVKERELPIDYYKTEILGLVETNSVIVIQGPTGCGKTTQVPQFILDQYKAKNEYCNIIVTQPRKIATINIARRVCQERTWNMGQVCGYQVGLEKKTSPDTILTYVTTGVLLQKLIAAKNLLQYTHVIIDEVHERNQDLDFLLLVVRKFLNTNSPNVKVILMSATIDAKELAFYFRAQIGAECVNAPIIYIEKRSEYRTQIYYADQLAKVAAPPDYDINNPTIDEDSYNILKFLIGFFNNIDEKDPVTNEKIIGSVLVFLPGIHEIEVAQQKLQCQISSNFNWRIVPLHSSLPNDEQAKAFYKPRPGERKIILSTNIAESSITVPDIYYVIDFCLTKNLTQDPETKFMCLALEWASHVNCDQRAGRVGRVHNGRVYRLVSQAFYEKCMLARSIPEMKRAPLERVVLHAKRLNLNEPPKGILALSLTPPDLNNIENTICSLKECGGLLTTCNDHFVQSDGDITFLGEVMSRLPIDVRLAKLIVLGHLYSCLHETIIIAAGCSIENIFKTPFQRRYEAYKKHLLWADGSCSDLIALLNLYQVWQSYKRQNKFSQNFSELAWADKCYVSLKALREWHLLINELTNRLKGLGIEETTGPQRVVLSAKDKPLILKTIICGAFYPNYFIRSSLNGQIDEREAVRTIGGRNPQDCVYFTGMAIGQPGDLYVSQVKKLIQHGEDIERKNDGRINVSFDRNSTSKVYVQFNNYKKPETVNIDGHQYITTIPGKIEMAVYESVRKRQLNFKFPLHIYSEKEAWDIVDNIKKDEESKCQAQLEDRNCFTIADYSALPTLDTEYIKIIKTWLEDASHFWCQNSNDETFKYIADIEKCLNRFPLKRVNPADLDLSKIYVARYREDNMFYRVRVQYCAATTKEDSNAYIIFIDYGNKDVVSSKELYELPDTLECKVGPLAFECVLTGIQPSLVLNPKAVWDQKINRLFDERISNIVLYAKVYSVVNEVVSLELYKQSPQRAKVSLNKWLIESGYADEAEESYLSKEDHLLRQKILAAESPSTEAERFKNYWSKPYEEYDCSKVQQSFKSKTIYLKGPFSPLEMKVYGTIESASNKNVVIEANSINTVLLDTDPQDPHARLLVSAHVGQSVSGVLKLRQTTLMPNMKGYPMFMCLLFCPAMEPKLTQDATHVASILCGLGSNGSSKSAFPSHDLVLALDTELDEEIINKVNELRYLMNKGIRIMDDIYHKNGRVADFISNQNDIKNHLLRLLQRRMKSIAPKNLKNANVWNHTLADYDYNEILVVDSHKEKDDIWPLHWFYKIRNFTSGDFSKKDNIEKLHYIAEKLAPEEEITCELCNVLLKDIYDVRFHIGNASHKKLENEFLHNLKYSDTK